MQWIIGLVVALICAALAFVYLPTPINWIVGLVLIVVIAVVALQSARGRRTIP